MNKKKLLGFSILSILLALAITPYILAPREDIILDDEFRASIVKSNDGNFINLSDGHSYYKLSGPENGDVAILIHGGGPPLMVWDKQIDAMNKAGIRVIRYDRYGSGYSDRVDKPYTADLFVRQIFDLFKALNIKKTVYIVGRSLGSYIAYSFSVTHPELVSKIALVSSSLIIDKSSISLRIPNIPILGRYMIRVLNNRIISSIESDYGKIISIENLKVYKKIMYDQIKIIGTENGMRSLFKSLASSEISPDQNLFSLKKPVLVIWGANDKLVSDKTIEEMKEKHPEVKYIKIKNSGHGVNFSHPELFNANLINLLNN